MFVFVAGYNVVNKIMCIVHFKNVLITVWEFVLGYKWVLKQDFMNFTYAKDEANLDKSSRFFTSVT